MKMESVKKMKKIFKVMFLISITFLLLSAFLVVVSALKAEASHSASIGIIGGADGPTAKLITGTLIFANPFVRLFCIATVSTVVSAVGWGIAKRK